MRSVQGYIGMRDAASGYEPQERVKVQIVVGPDPREVTVREVDTIHRCALDNHLLISTVFDECSALIALSGTAAQMEAFASAMTAV